MLSHSLVFTFIDSSLQFNMDVPKRSKTISLDLRMRVIQAHEADGEGCRKLSKRFNISENTITKMLKTYKNRKAAGLDPFEVDACPGRPKKTSVQTDRLIVSKTKRNPFITRRYWLLTYCIYQIIRVHSPLEYQIA